MSPVKKDDAEEERLAALEEMGIEEKALVYDEAGDELLVSDDGAAIKDFYARAFQEWALGNVEGQPKGSLTPLPFSLTRRTDSPAFPPKADHEIWKRLSSSEPNRQPVPCSA
jgi:hypothetical protein